MGVYMMEKRFLTFLIMSTGETHSRLGEKISSHPEKIRRQASKVYIYIYTCSLVFLVWALWHGLDDPTCVRSLGVAILPYLHSSISTALMRPRRPKQYCLQLVIYIYIWWVDECNRPVGINFLVYLSFSSHNIYVALLLCIEHCFTKVKIL